MKESVDITFVTLNYASFRDTEEHISAFYASDSYLY